MLNTLVKADDATGLGKCCVVRFGYCHDVPEEAILNGFRRVKGKRGLKFERIEI